MGMYVSINVPKSLQDKKHFDKYKQKMLKQFKLSAKGLILGAMGGIGGVILLGKDLLKQEKNGKEESTMFKYIRKTFDNVKSYIKSFTSTTAKEVILNDGKKYKLGDMADYLEWWYEQTTKQIIIGFRDKKWDQIAKWLEFGGNVKNGSMKSEVIVPYHMFKRLKKDLKL